MASVKGFFWLRVRRKDGGKQIADVFVAGKRISTYSVPRQFSTQLKQQDVARNGRKAEPAGALMPLGLVAQAA